MFAISFFWLIGCQFTGLASACGGPPLTPSCLGASAERLEVTAIGNDVDVSQWRDANQFLVCHLVLGGPELIDGAADMDGVPDQYGVGKQTEAAGLVHHLFVVAGAEAAQVGEEQRLREDMAELAAVEPQLDGVTQRLLVDYRRMCNVRPSWLSAPARRSGAFSLTRRCMTTWAGANRSDCTLLPRSGNAAGEHEDVWGALLSRPVAT